MKNESRSRTCVLFTRFGWDCRRPIGKGPPSKHTCATQLIRGRHGVDCRIGAHKTHEEAHGKRERRPRVGALCRFCLIYDACRLDSRAPQPNSEEKNTRT